MAFQSGQSEPSTANDSEYFRETYQAAVEDLERVKINRSWAEHYLKANQIDSAKRRLDMNTTKLFLERKSALQLELTLNYILRDRLSEDTDVSAEKLALLHAACQILEKNIPEGSYLSWAYLRLGICLWYSEQYGEAEEWWQKAYVHANKYGYSQVEIKALHHLGFIYTKQRKLPLSQSHYKYLLSLINTNPTIYREDQILALNALGNVFGMNDELDSALFYLNQGLEVLGSQPNKSFTESESSFYSALLNHNIGNVYKKSQKFGIAIGFLQQAIAVNEKIYGKSSTQLLRSLRDLGESYQALGQLKKAKVAYLKALEISKKSDYDQAKSYSRMGDYYNRVGKYALAIRYYDSALVRNSSFLNVKNDQYIYRVNMSNTIFGKGEAFAQMKEVDPAALEELYDSFLETLKFLHSRVDSRHISSWIPLTLEKIYIAYSKVYEQTRDNKWLERLWEITEVNKAFLLRNQLISSDSLVYALPKSLLKEEKALKESISNAMTKAQSGEFDSLLFSLNRDYEEFLKNLENNYPKYYALKNNLEIITLNETRRNLNKNTLLLNFLEGNQHLHILKIRKSGVSTKTILKSKIRNSINSHNQGIFSQSMNLVKSESDIIRNLLDLDSGQLAGIEHIEVVPDGPVWNLNFASILGDNKDFEFMGNLYTFSYRYFANQEFNRRHNYAQTVLAFSFSESFASPSGSRSSEINGDDTPIPGTSAELRSIAETWEGKYYYAQKANETTLKQQGGKYSILHFAVHGFLDEEKPENSYLKFATADSLNDGKLHAYEIYNLDLNADLAVLSTCHSGQGKVVAGEGMMSLGRAFAYAGVRSLLISRWEVSDYSAPHLMKYFYEGLKKGMYKSEALKHAQTQYLENHSDALTSSPFYWSSFYVLGDDGPIRQSTATFPSWVMWLLTIVLASGLILYVRKKSSSRA